MDIQEAIRHFKYTIRALKYLDNIKDTPYIKHYIKIRNAKNKRRLQASRLAIEALEKQTPKKPFINDYSLTCCPTCHGIEVIAGCESIELNHCNDCGQKLDWEVEANAKKE